MFAFEAEIQNIDWSTECQFVDTWIFIMSSYVMFIKVAIPA